MKPILHTLLVVLCLCGVQANGAVHTKSKDIVTDNIYITGSAFGQWDNEHPEAMTLTDEAEGIYQWTGNLVTGEFKFLLTLKSWTNCLNAEHENEVVEPGVEYTVVHVPNYFEEGNDYPFIIDKIGRYTIIVNMTEMTMVVTEEEVVRPDVYITGSALQGEMEQMVPAPKGNIGQYRYFGWLESGEVKFATNDGATDSMMYYVPVGEDVDLYGEATLTSTTDPTVRGFTVVVPDYYFIYIDIDAGTEYGFMHSQENLYIVGGATSVGWDCFAAIALEKEEDAPVYIYNGELRIHDSGDEPNLFKFLAQKDWGPNSFHPLTADESIIGSSVIVRNSPQDTKWSITEDQQGYYTIKLDIMSETMEVTFHGDNPPSSVPAPTHKPYSCRVADGSVHVDLGDAGCVQSAWLFDPFGRVIAHKEAQCASFAIGTQLSGMYLLRLVMEGKPYSEKIIVR